MARIKVGINGFGRIGRAFTRIALERNTFDIVVVNTRKPQADLMAYLLQYDSIYRKFKLPVSVENNNLRVGESIITLTQDATPEEIPWDSYGVDVVVDATGAFVTKEDLLRHIKGTVKKVILTAPSKDEETPHVVLGVNDASFDFAGEPVIANASCTTNCAAPMFKVLDDLATVTAGYLTTTHAYTQTQSLQDDANKSKDRSRAAALNTAPSTTGAAKAVAKVLPHLKGKLDGMAVRVPVPVGSFTDISAIVEKPITAEEINAAFKAASEGSMRGILGYETEMLVSADYIGNPNSCTFDANYTKVINGTLVKIFGWYDNEWGYSTRVVDLVERLQAGM
ncbi:type I glyceraldehyde-3-phosphate dehydrogenase [Candidatus Roizmanbacteria bacterium]|nr:type I glyceraldehyde-3-phosphate dehydrogenase [Candidatus Roizmanbacteria bacterium]